MLCANRRIEIHTIRTLDGGVHQPRAVCRAKSADRGIAVEICNKESALGLSSFLGEHCAFDATNESQCPHFLAA
jgi:hypothetical protein